MASRYSDFTNFENNQFNDVDNLLVNDSRTADVYRLNYDVDNPGFESEIGSEYLVKRILIHVARLKSAKRVGSDGMKASKTQWIGVTAWDGLQIEDVLLIAGVRYRVFDLDKTNKRVECYLERFSS